jgi:hypothetical protein
VQPVALAGPPGTMSADDRIALLAHPQDYSDSHRGLAGDRCPGGVAFRRIGERIGPTECGLVSAPAQDDATIWIARFRASVSAIKARCDAADCGSFSAQLSRMED